MKLRDYASNVYSQFGEDGIIDYIFAQIGTTGEFCVEFGASDSLECSNVANLWKNKDWIAVAIEADKERASRLMKLTEGSECSVVCRRVSPSGPDSIDHILSLDGEPIDFMSIDVDGNDYHIWRSMECKPRVLAVEFNPTIPPHLSLYQEVDSSMMGFGASLRALIELGEEKGYAFVGATEVNAFFVCRVFARHFEDLERDPMKLFPLEGFTFLMTDYLGAALAAGSRMPWGIHLPYDGPAIVGPYFSITESSTETIEAYRTKYTNIFAWPQFQMPNIANPDFVGPIPGGKQAPISARALLRSWLLREFSPICIAVDHVATDQVEWVHEAAEKFKYHCQIGGGVLVLTREKP